MVIAGPNGRVCAAHPVRVEALDELVWQQTCRLLEQPDLVLKEYATRLRKKQREQHDFKNLLDEKKTREQTTGTGKRTAPGFISDWTSHLTEIESRLKSIRAKIKKAQDECTLLEREEKEESHRLQLIEQFTDFTQRMKTNLSNLSFEERKQIVRLLVEEVMVNTSTDEITVRHILPLDQKFPLCKGSTLSADVKCPLDELDKELERRGHKFCRYADDCNIYVQSRPAGERVMASVTGFLEKRLRLKVNLEKKRSGPAWERKFLGYSMTWHKQPRLKVAKTSIQRLKAKLRVIFREGQGRSLSQVIEELNALLRGWMQYFRLAAVKGIFEELDGWIRRKLRCLIWLTGKGAKPSEGIDETWIGKTAGLEDRLQRTRLVVECRGIAYEQAFPKVLL